MAARHATLSVRMAAGALAALAAATGGAQSPARQPVPARIISVVPAVTEMLFAIGAGSRMAGVSSFDRFPPEVAGLPRVGALLDPDLERMLSLEPDLVVVYASQTELRRQLDAAGIAQFTYRHGGLLDVLATIRALGVRLELAAAAEAVAQRIERDLEDVRGRVAGRPRPKTLLVLGRDVSSLRNIFVSGGVGFLRDMLEIAGGDNVFGDVTREGLQATSELILARAPEVILELRGADSGVDMPSQAHDLDAWRALSAVPAVRAGRVHVLAGASLVVPGPRIAEGTRAMAGALHPGAFGR